MKKVQKNYLSVQLAAEKMFSMITEIDFLFPNYFDLTDVSNKYLDVASKFGDDGRKRFFFWVKIFRKLEMEKIFDYDIEDLIATFSVPYL